MKTTLELPDELMRSVKVRAASEGRSLKDVMSELVRRGLAGDARLAGVVAGRVSLPLVQCAHSATSSEATPERVAALLLEEEKQHALTPGLRQ